MMKKPLLILGPAIALALSACVDNKYDLGDVDTTSRLAVNDLVLPITIDEVYLRNIFDIDNSSAVQVVDGEYAVVEDGAFNSSTVHIDPVTLAASVPSMASTTLQLEAVPPGVEFSASYAISSGPMAYSVASTSVPACIKSIESVESHFTVTISLALKGLEGIVRRVDLRDVVFECPKGLNATASIGSYDPSTGRLTIADYVVNGTSLDIVLACQGIDYAAAGGVYDAAMHRASMSGDCRIVSGHAAISSADVIGQLPEQTVLSSACRVSDVKLLSFTGDLLYDVEDVHVNDIAINGLPGIIGQEHTSLILMNPQIYLRVTNPLAKYGVAMQSGLVIQAYHPDGSTYTYAKRQPMEIGAKDVSAIVLSPTDPEKRDPGFADAQWQPYVELGNVLAGEGIPHRLSVRLTNPQAYGHVDKLPVGQGNMGKYAGDYKLLAPLDFAHGTEVIYTDTENGWNGPDVDAITIEKLEVSALVSSDLPFEVKFTGYPIDVDGNDINDVQIEGAHIPEGGKDLPVTIRITGEVQHLDGIRFVATAVVTDDMPSALRPDQTLHAAKIRAKVSGYYQKEL